METLITGCYPAVPPVPSYCRYLPPDGKEEVSCAHLNTRNVYPGLNWFLVRHIRDAFGGVPLSLT